SSLDENSTSTTAFSGAATTDNVRLVPTLPLSTPWIAIPCAKSNTFSVIESETSGSNFDVAVIVASPAPTSATKPVDDTVATFVFYDWIFNSSFASYSNTIVMPTNI